MIKSLVSVAVVLMAVAVTGCSKYIVSPGPYGQPQVQQVPSTPPATQPPAPTTTTPQGTPTVTPIASLPPAPSGTTTFVVMLNIQGVTCDILKNGSPWCSGLTTNGYCRDVLSNRTTARMRLSYRAVCTIPDEDDPSVMVAAGTATEEITLRGRPRTRSTRLISNRRSLPTEVEDWTIERLKAPR